jgi:hypothetical protein
MSPTLAGYIIAVYKAMDSEAVVIEDNRVYIGSLSTLVKSLAPSTYYAPITRSLYDGGYAALLDRGGRSKPSTLILLREPQVDELMALTIQPLSPIVSLVNRIESLETSIGGMNVISALSEVDRRLQVIEAERLERSGKIQK